MVKFAKAVPESYRRTYFLTSCDFYVFSAGRLCAAAWKIRMRQSSLQSVKKADTCTISGQGKGLLSDRTSLDVAGSGSYDNNSQNGMGFMHVFGESATARWLFPRLAV
ncbi:MAG: hypothetical protein ACNI3A_16425 [Desulfovibrio sp.]|uniref:hypothetical protein n=1 Tax=Desulfovibrio sp. 7SRBS1 TaxID=3378064 RepID=UPI003B411D3D